MVERDKRLSKSENFKERERERERERVKDVDEVAQQKLCKIYCKASIIRYNIV